MRFEELGIKKLISTSYAPKANNRGAFYSPNPGLFDHVLYDEKKDFERGKIFTLQDKDINKDGVINIDDLEWEYLEGDGDFRSDEIKALRNEADIVITNPPFSLFREFMAWLVEGEVLFSIIGNMNAVTYKEVFPLIKNNKVWLGVTRDGNGSMWFRIPDNAPESASGQKTDENGNRWQTVGSTAWFTNIQHGRRHTPLSLMPMEDNKRFNKKIAKNANSYKVYDNYNAIEVPYVLGIPSDFKGAMGVPITFLSKYCPEQFEIIKFRHGDDGKDLGYIQDDGTRKTPYFRILIRHISADQEA